MSLFSTPGDITITSHKRITPWLEQELETLRIKPTDSFITGVHLRGTINDCILLNCQLRCASQVLYSLGKFKASDADEVYRQLTRFEWENIIPEGGYFSVTSNVHNDTINNSMFANLRVKDAIADRLRTKRGARPSTGAELSGTVIHLFWKDDHAEIFIDTSGPSLARHGYRKIPGQAPMLEALASAVIYASKWNRMQPFVNPMCGSGTLAIEAAMIATNRKPGLFRDNYAFMHLKGYDEEVYRQQDALLELQIKDNPKPRIIATDYSEQAIENARKNAIAAGVADMIEFKVCDFADTPVPTDTPGVVMFNPEYGERLGTVAALEQTYARIGDFMKKSCGGYYGYIFTGNLELAKKIGLKASRRIEFYNSTIDCRLLEYELYRGSKKAAKQDIVEDKTRLRQATQTDADELSKAMEVLIKSIPYYNDLAKQHEVERYSANSLAVKMKEDPYSVIIAETDNNIAGFCVSRFDDYTVWLEWFGVTEENRGKGITKKLLQKLEETVNARQCHKIWCDCRTTNQAAIHILSEAGYTQIATIPNHWYKQDFILWQKFIAK